MQDGHETRVDLDEGSSQGERTVSYVPKRSRQGDRQREPQNLRKQVNDLEIELKGRHHRRVQDDLSVDPDYIPRVSSQRSGSNQSRERSYETTEQQSKSPHHGQHGHYNAALNNMSRALRRATQSPFTYPQFIIYDGKTDQVEHVSHYIQMLLIYSYNDRLMCKVFPSSLGLTAMRWFNGLRKGSI